MSLDFRYPTIADLRRKARRRLPHFAYEYLDSATGAELSAARARHALDRVQLTPRALLGTPAHDLSTEILGQRFDLPFGVSPVGMAGLFWPGAESILAAECARSGMPFGLSTVAAAAPEDVAGAFGAHGWFQLYPPEEMAHNLDLLDRAWAAGFRTLVLTVDVPGPSRRERSRRSGLTTPPKLTPRIALQSALRPVWSLATLRHGMPKVRSLIKYAENTGYKDQVGLGRHRAPDETYFAAIRAHWQGPILAKGVLAADEARRLVDLGCDGIWVSNHGGRQFDAAPAPAEALPGIRAALPARVPLIYDGAVGSGLDVLRAVALGADMVMLGRGWLWGLAALGPRGAAHVTHLLRDDLQSAMTQMGISRPTEARGLLWQG